MLCRETISVDKMRRFTGALAKLRKATISFIMSVCVSVRPHWTTERIFRKSAEKIRVSLRSCRSNSYFTWRPVHFWSYLAQFFLKWETFQTKVVEKLKIHVLCSVTFLGNRQVCEILWENIVEPVRPQMTIRRMRIACWIPKATNTHSKYVILIVFPLQQWSHEGPLVLRYTCIFCTGNVKPDITLFTTGP